MDFGMFLFPESHENLPVCTQCLQVKSKKSDATGYMRGIYHMRQFLVK